MKLLLFFISVIFTSIGFGQSKDCELPKTWVPDRSTLSVSKFEKEENRIAIDLEELNDNIILPDSVTLINNKVMNVWYDGVAFEGKFKVSRSKIKWSLADEKSKVSVKAFRRAGRNSPCDIIEDGITFFSNRKKNHETSIKYIAVNYQLKPQIK